MELGNAQRRHSAVPGHLWEEVETLPYMYYGKQYFEVSNDF